MDGAEFGNFWTKIVTDSRRNQFVVGRYGIQNTLKILIAESEFAIFFSSGISKTSSNSRKSGKSKTRAKN